MKLLAHISLALLLLTSSMGVTVASHYCGNTLHHISVNAETNPCCDKASMPEGCCHDDIEYFSVDEQYQGQNLLQISVPEFTLFSLISFFVHELLDYYEQSLTWISYQSPPLAESDIYIRVQSFLI